jgi:phosphoribosylformylglycinamidine (FGAM) synthase-like amidotransferase family enzyme
MLWTHTKTFWRNVAGLMPHPERACEPLLGSDDSKWIFKSIFAALKSKTVAACT